MYLARELTPLSLAQIAREFDRNHTTVLHAIRGVEAKSEPGTDLAGDINTIRSLLGETRPSLGSPDHETNDPPPSAQS